MIFHYYTWPQTVPTLVPSCDPSQKPSPYPTSKPTIDPTPVPSSTPTSEESYYRIISAFHAFVIYCLVLRCVQPRHRYLPQHQPMPQHVSKVNMGAPIPTYWFVLTVVLKQLYEHFLCTYIETYTCNHCCMHNMAHPTDRELWKAA